MQQLAIANSYLCALAPLREILPLAIAQARKKSTFEALRKKSAIEQQHAVQTISLSSL